ncbi:MAG: ABC transporter ATP-binding protein, partial [Hasllibacter sp.]
YALYPHMTVRENMGFGLRMNGHPRAEIAEKVDRAAGILKLDEYLDRKPVALSGGQRQRVAIGRAIVRGPEVFLFDEPLSNLDAELRVDMRVEIARLHDEIGATMIYVTHDQVEAMTMADKIVVLRAGVIEQVGAPMDLFRDPDNRFVAGFIGSPSMNFAPGEVVEGGVLAPAYSQAPIPAPVALPPVGTRLEVGLRPQHLRLAEGATHEVDLTENLGGVSYVYADGPDGTRVTMEAGEIDPLARGERVGVEFDPARIYLFDGDGARLR